MWFMNMKGSNAIKNLQKYLIAGQPLPNASIYLDHARAFAARDPHVEFFPTGDFKFAYAGIRMRGGGLRTMKTITHDNPIVRRLIRTGRRGRGLAGGRQGAGGALREAEGDLGHGADAPAGRIREGGLMGRFRQGQGLAAGPVGRGRADPASGNAAAALGHWDMKRQNAAKRLDRAGVMDGSHPALAMAWRGDSGMSGAPR